MTFFLIACGLIALFIILALPFTRRSQTPAESVLFLAIRYAAAAALLAFAAGMAMSANQGPRLGQAGNLLAPHALGFHGLQALPLVALLATWAGVAIEGARRWVHQAGLAWLGACMAVGW